LQGGFVICDNNLANSNVFATNSTLSGRVLNANNKVLELDILKLGLVSVID
jgi:hypothetical protein